MCDIYIVTMNCRGLAEGPKRRELFKWLREKKVDIALLQDTHWTPQLSNYITSEWGYRAYFASYKSNARGVAILLNNTFEFEVKDTKSDIYGNYIFIEMELPGIITLIIGSIYGPNSDCPEFYHGIEAILNDFENPNVIMAGDWNFTLNQELDNLHYKNKNNPKASKTMLELMLANGWVDYWRVFYPDRKKYTWSLKSPAKHARLDYFVGSEELTSAILNPNIETRWKSDHAPVSVRFNVNGQQRGRGVWKFNNSLLMYKDFKTVIMQEIGTQKAIYAATPYNPEIVENFPNKDIQLTISYRLFWETLLTVLRGTIITFAAKKKREAMREEKFIADRLKPLEEKELEAKNNRQETIELEQLRNDMEALRKVKLQGTLVRSRARWIEFGEKSSKYFLNLEKRNFVNKSITELKLSKDKSTKDQKEILKLQREFYKSLYSKRTIEQDHEYEPDLSGLPKVRPNEKILLNKELEKTEVDVALKSLKNNKSPGPDGYSAEFFKFFWDQLGDFCFCMIKESLDCCELPGSLTRGIITCLPKQGKTRDELKNWRPISLLNTTYKLISTTLTNRLKRVLPDLIHADQKGFMANRSIMDNTRLMMDIMVEMELQNRSGLILLVDYEKAFDSLSWDCISTTLQNFDFGEKMIKWIETLRSNSKSCVTLNGHLSEYFDLERGCRQGDPISPYLFILCGETLSTAIRNDNKIEGLEIHGKEHKISQYADDTSLYLKDAERCLAMALEALHWFYCISGLKINIKKTKVIRIGKIRETDRRYCRENDLDWVDEFTSLGIVYRASDIRNITRYNIENKLNDIKKLLNVWLMRNISPVGRIQIVKSLALSKLTHLFMSLPSPDAETLKKLEKMFNNFVWRNGRHCVNKDILQAPVIKGGLNMINIPNFDLGLKLTWLRKMIKGHEPWLEIAENLKMDQLLYLGPKEIETIRTQCSNPFWQDVCRAAIKLHNNLEYTKIEEIRKAPLWGNILINCPTCHWLIKGGIREVGDLFDNNGEIFSRNDLQINLNRQIPFVTYHGLITAIPRTWKTALNENPRGTLNMSLSKFQDTILQDKKGCRAIREVFQNLDVETGWVAKWSLSLNTEIDLRD